MGLLRRAGALFRIAVLLLPLTWIGSRCVLASDISSEPEVKPSCRRIRLVEAAIPTDVLSVPKVYGPNQLRNVDGHQELPYWWRPGYDPEWKGEPRFIDRDKFKTLDLPGVRGPEVVRIANPRFERSWGNSPQFMEMREELAKHYAPQSDYFITQARYPKVNGVLDPAEVPSTMGYTFAKFNRRDFEGEGKDILKRLKSLVDEKGNAKPGFEAEVAEIRSKIVPGEEYLGVLFKRDGMYDKNGDGILIEFRTNSKELGSPDRTSDEAAVWMVGETMKIFKKHPEFYDKRVNVTYADRAHGKLYRKKYKMKVQHETTPLKNPISISDTEGDTIQWWVVDTTLRKWESQLFNLRGFRVVEGLNQPHPFELPGFPEKRMSFSRRRDAIAFDTEGNITHATMNEDTEVAPGVFAPKGRGVDWHAKRVVTVPSIVKPLPVEFEGMEFVFPVESNVGFDNRIGTGVATTHPDKPLMMDPRGFPKVISGSNLDGIKVPKSDLSAEWVHFQYDTASIEMRVHVPADLGGGVVPRKDTELNMKWVNGKWLWTQVTLKDDVVINGVKCEAGQRLYHNGKTIRVLPAPNRFMVHQDVVAIIPDPR